MKRDSEHIWLRQSVVFTRDGRTRTLEIAIPLRLGATAEEIESLLREADDGMDRLSWHLDARVAALLGEATPPREDVVASAPQPAAPEAPPVAVEPAAASGEAAGERHPIALRPASPPPPAAPQRQDPPPTPARGRPVAPLVRETPAADTVAQRPVHQSPTEPLTLPQFLAEAQSEFGFGPRQVMEKLGVRSLSGVNYREALESLRRQALRENTTTTMATQESEHRGERQTSSAPQAQAPRYFEEEEEDLDAPEVIFGAEDDVDQPSEQLDPYGGVAGRRADDEGDEGDEMLDGFGLEAQRDFLAPASSVPTPLSLVPRSRPTAPAASKGTAPGNTALSDEHARIAQLIGQLREAQTGGVPSSHQRSAYRNIVVRELGDEKAKALVAGLYRVTSERLGPEQLDALSSWGKRDTFADDADLVLATLRAERTAQRTSAENGSPRTPRAPKA